MSGFDESYPETTLDIIAKQIFEEDLNVLWGFNNKHPEYYMELIYRTKFLPHYAPLKERFWHLYHRTDKKPKCALEGCMNPVGWHKIYAKHNTYCNKTCSKTAYWKKKRAEKEKTSNL